MTINDETRRRTTLLQVPQLPIVADERHVTLNGELWVFNIGLILTIRLLFFPWWYTL